ncbi:MAG TPA: hypothetical protein PKC28_13870 [Bdellovibrionales bacterium]|nr:hypothetical protein [Bdellovibrionales bacterium]
MITRALVLVSLSIALAAAAFHEREVCGGFLPENTMDIPITAAMAGSVTEAEFHEVLDRVQAHYGPILSASGKTLVINRDWASGTVNASANQSGRTYFLNMYGGLARHQVMTKDGFMLVACHEMGHHIAGAPKVDGWFGLSWASNEGQSDYYATLRCLRALFTEDETDQFLKDNQVDPVLQSSCQQAYATPRDQNFCMRMGMAGFAGASLFHSMRELTVPLAFNTPDTSVVSETDDSHPQAQCRLDTYYQGALCMHDTNVALSDTNPNIGTCTTAGGQSVGLRPLCWFRP